MNRLPRIPGNGRPSLPDVFNGEIYRQVGKYSRGAILYAFEQIGGPDGLAKWAKDNPDDFYTKLFPKVVARESEVQHVRGVDDLMDLLDAEYQVISEDGAGVEDAEIMEVDAAMEFGAPPMMEDEEQGFRMTYGGDDWDFDEMVDFPDE